MAAGGFEPVKLSPAKPDELVYSLAEPEADQSICNSRPPGSRHRKTRPVTRADRELANEAIRTGAIKVTRCAPGYSAHIRPRVLR
ncbi:MAG: hypothetical protein AAF441_11650 [Pseudomonadota bacterium]